MPVVDATDENLRGYGRLVDDPRGLPSRSCAGRHRGWRTVDTDTGDEGWHARRVFSHWDGDPLYGHNEAVGGHILAYAQPPEQARPRPTTPSA